MMLETNGIQFHYDTYGDGEPLLWLHGMLGHGADWRYIFEEPPAGYRLLAPDLRGHGRSTGERHQREGQLETLFAQGSAFADGHDPNFTPDHLATITADTLIVFGS